MQSLVTCSRPAAASLDPHAVKRHSAGSKRLPRARVSAAQTLLRHAAPHVPAVAAADEQALSALASLQHPASIHPSNLVPALQTALLSLHQRPGSRGWERALLASPMVLGLLSWATQLLEQPATAAALGPEAPLLVLEALSHLGCAPAGASAGAAAAAATPEASRAAQHCRRLWRRAHAALGDAADAAGQWTLHSPDLMSPDMIVRYYEACARAVPLAAAPSKSPGLGLMLRAHLRNRRFSADECVRLLSAWAALRRRMPFNPDTYNFAELASSLAGGAEALSGAQLQAVASAAPAFHWPVYRSMPLLHAVCRQAVHRSLAGALPLPVAQRTLSAAVRGVAGMHPRLAHDLQAATCEWMRDAPVVVQPSARGTAPADAAAAADEANNALPCHTPSLSPLAGSS